MVPSLTVVLPVHNAEAGLADQVCRLLEVLPDLAERFEILVVDDGSTDHTGDIAAELSRQFPQLRSLRLGRRKGAAAAVQAGMEQSTSEFVVVQDGAEPISPQDLRRLWAMRNDENLVVARTLPKPPPVDAGLMSRLIQWGRGVERAAQESPLASNTQLIRRAAVNELAAGASMPLKVDRQPHAERIARVAPRRRNVVTGLRDFALGE